MKQSKINQLSYAELNAMLAKIQFQMFSIRLNKVIATFNQQTTKSSQIANKIETLIVLVKRELLTVKRITIIEDYLTELEVLLDLDLEEEN